MLIIEYCENLKNFALRVMDLVFTFFSGHSVYAKFAEVLILVKRWSNNVRKTEVFRSLRSRALAQNSFEFPTLSPAGPLLHFAWLQRVRILNF